MGDSEAHIKSAEEEAHDEEHRGFNSYLSQNLGRIVRETEENGGDWKSELQERLTADTCLGNLRKLERRLQVAQNDITALQNSIYVLNNVSLTKLIFNDRKLYAAIKDFSVLAIDNKRRLDEFVVVGEN